MRQSKEGFTLIELLIVIGILGFLAAAVLVAVDPVRRIQDSRNAQRWSEVNSLLDAMLKKQVDDRSLYDGENTAPVITGAVNSQVIVEDDAGVTCTVVASRPGCDQVMNVSAGAKDCVANLSGLIPDYIAEIPTDPGTAECTSGSGCTTEGGLDIGTSNSGYYIHRTTGNRIEIGACQPEQSAVISVRR